MCINSPDEFEGLRAAGKIVRLMIEAMKQHVRPGVTTAELDESGARVMREHGARSAPRLVYGFPGTSCISVNEEAVHGIPGSRALREGDIVKLDVTTTGKFTSASKISLVPASLLPLYWTPSVR